MIIEVSFLICALAVFGLAMGSFAGAQVWRLRARQLVEDKQAGEAVDKAEYNRLLPLTKPKLKNDRSRCLSCGHTLAARDLVPLFSWLSTGGKCRYCQKPIGWFEPAMEVITAVLFVLAGLSFFVNLLVIPVIAGLQLLLLLVAIVLLVILLAYDFKWGLLPNKIMYPLIGVSAIYAVISLALGENNLFSLFGSVLILGGLYGLLWVVSKGQWIGFGDVKLGLALGLLLSDWRLAFAGLFLANFIGCLIVIPGMTSGKVDRKAHIPFGPLLILGFFIAYFGKGFLLTLPMLNILN